MTSMSNNAGAAVNMEGQPEASMGIAVADFDGNATIDLFMTHFFGDTNTYYSNHGNLYFEDWTRQCNLSASSRQTLFS